MVFVSIVFFAALLSTSLATYADEDKLKSVSVNASTRAELALKGLFHYFWRNDTVRKHIQFFFACGQIGGGGNYGEDYGSCECVNPSACTYCYRWWDAIALESVATYGIYSNTRNFSTIASTIYAHSPYNSEWNATAVCTFMDDFTWYGIAYLRVYEWLKNPIWLNRSIALLDWAWEYGWDEPCGGIWWSNCDFSLYKDSITMLEFLHLSSKLAYLLPNETDHLERAERVWNWIFSFDDGLGLMTDKGLVSTGAVPERCCNNTNSDVYNRCHNTKVPGTSYNQGVLMSSAAYLYRRTGDTKYLNTGLRALDAIFANYTTKEGILIDEPRGLTTYVSYCYYGGDPGGDWYSFSGIFMLHLSYFTELLYENGSLPNTTLDKIRSLVEKTSDTAWNRSAVWPSLAGKVGDVCNLGEPKPNPNITYPKFHWWWGQEVKEAGITPPDPRYFFHKSNLRCHSIGDDTQMWEGELVSELECTIKCQKEPLCSKYLFAAYDVVEGINCWLWSYNRTDHACNTHDYDFYVGIKRPVGNTTCAGQCGSNKPQKLELGGVCYCDAACAQHLDCCIDYADQCLPEKVNSCAGQCKKTLAQPIPGGGYCWCSDTDLYGTDGWCPDFIQQCQKVAEPVCLDARSQGSALNLFIAHMKIANITNQLV